MNIGGCYLSLSQPAILVACNSSFCVYPSHMHSFSKQDTEHTRLFLPRGDSSKVTSHCCIQLKSHNSWVMFIQFFHSGPDVAQVDQGGSDNYYSYSEKRRMGNTVVTDP